MTKHSTVLVTALLAAVHALFAPAPVARADVFQWEYINPANPSQGKQQSTMLAPDGAGVVAAPGADLSNRNLTKAYLIGADLSTQVFYEPEEEYVYWRANLAGATLSQADLSNTDLRGASMVGANLIEATLTNANLSSYSNGYDVYYSGANLSGANLSRANLSSANFYECTLTNADLSQASLGHANFHSATMTGANLTGAYVRGADFFGGVYGGTGITVAQLASTASYQAHDLVGIKLGGNTLIGANLAGQNLTGSFFTGADLTGANFSQANLAIASFYYATLSGADFTGADVRGATFYRSDRAGGTGLTAAQIYSTASYQAHDLRASLDGNNLPGINLVGQNMSPSSFISANLTGADLRRGTFTNSWFYGATLSGANFSQADLRNTMFIAATLDGANLTGADVRGANFTNHIFGYELITLDQLYSTASYQARDLSGILLGGNQLAGADLRGQNLRNANFSGQYENPYYGAVLTGANFSHANLHNANFAYTTLAQVNLSSADARGAQDLTVPASANSSNLIQPNGHVSGLDLRSGKSLPVRDFDGDPTRELPPIGITIDQHLLMDASSALEMIFEADAWDSVISFAPGIPVALGGTLELAFAPDVDVATQSGRTIDLFDWTGVTPTGAFTVSSPYSWNLSKLYTTGEVTLATLPAIPGDFNLDGTVDTADYVVWRNGLGTTYTQTDYNLWRAHFGTVSPGIGAGSSAADPLSRVPASAEPPSAAVPEPASCLLLLLGTLGRWRARRFASEMLAGRGRSTGIAYWHPCSARMDYGRLV